MPGGKRILFVPWTMQEDHATSKYGGWDYTDKNNAWITHHKGKEKRKQDNDEGYVVKTIHQIYYSPTAQSFLLSNLGPEDQVYIRGHSLTGLTFIFLDKHNGNTLQAVEVAARLESMGLRTTFSGIIKCYNCHSYEGDPNFAQTFTNIMYGKGFTQCTFIGYRGALDSYPGSDHTKSEEERYHKYAVDRVKLSGGIDLTMNRGRASNENNRFVVTPELLQ